MSGVRFGGILFAVLSAWTVVASSAPAAPAKVPTGPAAPVSVAAPPPKASASIKTPAPAAAASLEAALTQVEAANK